MTDYKELLAGIYKRHELRGFYVPEDIADLAAAIRELLSRDAEREKAPASPANLEPCAWAVWIEVAGMPDFDSIWQRPEFAHNHLNEMLQTDWGEPIKSHGVIAMTYVQDDHYPLPEWLRERARKHIANALPPGSVVVPKSELEWIAEQWDDSQPSHELTHRLYDISCTAKKLLQGDNDEISL